MKNKDDDLHKDHRERLRKKFEENSSILEDHELLELLLFSIRPRINTNGIARRLVQKFGSIDKVFAASAKELKSVEGVGEQTAMMLKLQYELLKRFASSFASRDNLRLTTENAGRYITSFFAGDTKENLIMLALDKECRIIKQAVVASGTNNRVHADISNIVKTALGLNAVYVIVAHNHPRGVLEPSAGDVRFTVELERALSFIEVRLIDHIIVSGEKYLSIANWLGLEKREDC